MSNSDRDLNFKQWLAGLIDGDGCFLLSKKGYASLEITMDIRDERALQAVKRVYGGSIKLRSNANALRYRLHHKEGLLNLINDVNGQIRNSNRMTQLNKICLKYNLILIWPEKLTKDNGWLSGFFDACGNIQLSPSSDGLSNSPVLNKKQKGADFATAVENRSQLVISLVHKEYNLVISYKDLFGGNINIVSNGQYEWSISYLKDRDQILNFLEFVKKYTLRSHLQKRFFLIPKFFELVEQLDAYQAPKNSMISKSWVIFNNKFQRRIHTNSGPFNQDNALIKLSSLGREEGEASSNLSPLSSEKVTVWGSSMGSGVGSGRLTKQVLEMYKLSNFQYSIVVGLVLSDGYINLDQKAKNPRLCFKQSLDKFPYLWNVFCMLSPFCKSLPQLTLGKRNHTITFALYFFTRSLPCLKEIHQLFYSAERQKIIPENIYHILTPMALAQVIMGDGQKKDRGLGLCTDSYTLPDVVRLMNVLIIRYNLIGTIRENRPGQYRIYISQKSMYNLRKIVSPYFVDSMLYKINSVK